MEKIVVCVLELGLQIVAEKERRKIVRFNSFSSMISHLTLQVNYVRKVIFHYLFN